MNDIDFFDRVYGCLIGQAVGDALGAPTEGKSVSEIRDTYGWIEDFVSDDPAGTDDTEYAMLTAQILLKYGNGLSAENMMKEWNDTLVGQKGGFYGGGFSEMNGIGNLKKGLAFPHTGSDNHERWSDGAAMRIAPVGLYCLGDPAEAARLAKIEAQISHARDGVYCAQAIAASVAFAGVSAGSDWERVIRTGLDHIPQDSWTYRKIKSAVEIGLRHSNMEEAVVELHDSVSIFYYPWADVGPEATALAYGVFAAARGAYVPAVLGGVNVGRDSDTIAAMSGAMAGALHGAGVIPERWRRQINIIRGHCIHATAGIDIAALSKQLSERIAGSEKHGA
ncbi:ADP-ribosylglycohydrolase family protein [Cohnella herbarum]|uniref:ADP-ribosylglycohydrolase family protein n=1 Tax=Cohnella herbarum TaxID=2728023 RepID=UPI0020C4DC92|nr:ADP-ribosylglycohydrolase family protein [Cohnella herbarum]